MVKRNLYGAVWGEGWPWEAICRAEKRPVEFEIMDHLNALAKFNDAGTPFGPVRFVEGNGGFWIECPKTGFGWWYTTLREAVRRTGMDAGSER